MADNPQKTGHPRPLSPHLSIYRWQMTMLGSIVHRATGMALSVGALALAWWLVAISNGPESYETFTSWATSPLGLIILFGFTWSLAFHLLNGVRHLAWDLGYGFEKHVATQTATLVFVASLVIAVGLLAIAWTGHAGYLS
jgi:succinate dehydrogenase / fumarate reductase cytochrome b subunit